MKLELGVGLGLMLEPGVGLKLGLLLEREGGEGVGV